MAISRMDRNEEHGGRRGGGERELDPDDGDRERRIGRFGRWDEDRGRDDDRPRYQGRGGQSGSQAGGVSDNMYREQTGYRDRDMYRRESAGYDRGADRDYGGTLGRVDHPYRQEQQPGSQWGTSGPFGGGGHRGKGPLGYTRSDERIREDVCDALSDDDHVDASNIDIQVKNGEVTLMGTVPDRRTKRLAEDCIEHVRGVKDVTNNLRLQDSPERDTDNGKRPRA